MSHAWYTPLTNTFGYSILYYYYFCYYLIFSFYDLPDPDDTSWLKPMKQRIWCNVSVWKLWNSPSADLFGGESTLGHGVTLYFITRERRSNLSFIRLLSAVYRLLFFLLLLVYPIFVLLVLYVPVAVMNGYADSAWFKSCVQDPVTVLGRLCADYDIEYVVTMIAKQTYYIDGMHRQTFYSFLLEYYPNFNNLRETFQVVNKKVMAEQCYKQSIPHPPALQIWKDYDWSHHEEGFAIKPCWGAWHGEALWDDSVLYFVDTQEALEILENTKPGRHEVMAQKKMFADPEVAVLWGGKKKLEGFRVYSAFIRGEYSVLPSIKLLWVDLDGSGAELMIRADKKEIGLLYKDTFEGSTEYKGKQFNWLDRLDEMQEIVIDAHKKLMPNIVLSAWDTAITTEGVVIVESNIGGDTQTYDFEDEEYAKIFFDATFEEFRQIRDFRRKNE